MDARWRDKDVNLIVILFESTGCEESSCPWLTGLLYFNFSSIKMAHENSFCVYSICLPTYLSSERLVTN